MKNLGELLKFFEQHHFLLLTDAHLPSLTSWVAQAPIKGSWWGHPQGKLMYNLSQDLMDEPDFLTVKLVNKKLTFIPRRHWPALVTMAQADQDWQWRKLSAPAIKLYELVQTQGELRADSGALKKSPAEIGKLASTLEERLLIYSESLHTESGKHVRLLRSWKEALKTKKFRPKKMHYEQAQAYFESIRKDMMERFQTKVRFPWNQ